ncbi:MAG: indolepyruvate ferredoxin oxidoreductase [Desulfobulbaceae bacterium]|nr:indolepyruvate ferredoxin oxidoreductase [Desulfobulbaceae bacterium]
MKKMGEMLLRKPGFKEIVMGNTALVRAMIESGTRVITSYPGSPTPEVATAIQTIPQSKRPFYFEFSTNEKVATEVAFGAALNGHLSTVFFKSVGLNVAADTFVQLSLLNIVGGMVVVLGDDPGANSSQNEQDNRHFGYLSYTPVFEPANPAEVYLYYKEAAALSRQLGKVVILRLTTHVCHAKEKVEFAGWNPIKLDNCAKFSTVNGPYIPLVAAVYPMKERALRQLSEIETWVEDRQLHSLVNNNSRLGIITSGLVYLSLLEVLEDNSEKPDVLKLAMVYPVPGKVIVEFLKSHDEVKILEELDDELERSIKSIAYDQQLTTKIIGKNDINDWIGEYTPEKIRQILHDTWPELMPEGERIPLPSTDVGLRSPQMCPGCGHRSAFHAIGQVLADEDITVADIGCHTLGYQPPYNLGEVLLCMGASTGVGSGLSLFNNERKVVAFLGDSTLFHAGLPGIVNAVFNQHNLTLIVMENGTTAMTGHQDNPASGKNFNQPSETIPIRKLLEGLGVQSIYETDTYKQKELSGLVKKAIGEECFNVVIAKHPCMLLFAKKQRRRGVSPSHVLIDQEKCQKINVCLQKFGCPSFKLANDGTVSVNNELCIGDGSCIETCPQKAIKR